MLSNRIEEIVADKWKEKSARILWWRGDWWNSDRFFDLVDRNEEVLRRAGFVSGQRLVTLLPNSPVLLAISIACWRIGGAIVPLNLQEGERLLVRAVRHADPFAVIGMEEKLGGMALDDVPVLEVSLTGILPEFNGREKSRGDSETAFLFYTSGTTGLPKAVPLSHNNIVSDVTIARRNVVELTEDDIFLNVLPNFHTLGFIVSSVLPMILALPQVVMASFMPPERVLEAIMETKATALVAVPTMVAFLVAAVARSGKRPESLRVLISGGDRFPEKLESRVRHFLGVDVLEGYGLTECSPVVACNPSYARRRRGTVGPLFPEIDAEVRDEEGRVLQPNEEGILWLRGPVITSGYFRDPENTNKKFIDGWFNTGDVVRMDEDRYITIMDRASDIIIVGGFNVYPQEVEGVLNAHPSVRESAVVGISHSISGQIVKAFVIGKEDAEVNSSELIAWSKERLAHYKVPRKIEFVDDFPRSSLGKVLRRRLRDR